MRRSLDIAAALLIFALPAAAQQQPPMNMEEIKSAAPYHPGLGELMTAFVQPRHIKLGLASAQHDWAYAAYELGELRETFADVAELVPKHGDLVVREAIASTMKQPMEALDAAIKTKDAAGFTKAYGALTEACNACHKSADHPMIVIKVPSVTGTAFPDQEFAPQPRK